ncbi:hypothetical protein LUZ63_019676 [Rhynchospora breviuscula]|uniref:Glycosyltransferase n=1 Tax=Rhynchospora breviuscula TaxID=2022672 RepID=A0A9Q0HJA1_9POAL|nr:hypothetical protein LUZ63_019676 [Rhynchospora breviuscula]
MANINKPSVYFLPIPAPGHLISMLEVVKSLLQWNSTTGCTFSIHILLTQPKNPGEVSPICSNYFQSLQSQNLPIHFHPLPYVEPPYQYDGVEDFVTLYIRSYLPYIKAELLASPSPVSGLVVDMFGSDVIDVAKELNIPSYIYFTSTATFLSVLLHLSNLQGKHDKLLDFSEVEEICVPGLTPIPSASMPIPLLDVQSASYKRLTYHASESCTWLTYHARRFLEAKGIIINSNIHIEMKAVEALAKGITLRAPGRIFPEVYPIGPVISFGRSNIRGYECLKWLHEKPAKSVLFLCFGNMGFDVSQVRQIAIGLEQSGHRFLWVLRTPSKDFLRGPSDANLEILPEGFIERTKERGLVWPRLAPQIDILSHQAIGGFVTHCGWNSILESLWFGVPMIPWPIHSEQHLNAFQLVNEMHVAVNLDVDINKMGFVSAMELERAIKQLMEAGSEEGRRVREQVEEVKSACRKAAQIEGVSFVHLQTLAGVLGKVRNVKPAVPGSGHN